MNDREINLAELWDMIWSGRILIAVVSIVATLAVATYSLFIPEWYKAEVVLAPVNRQSMTGGGLGGLGVVGGLAALAGVNLSPMGEHHPIAVLNSKDFARGFIDEHGLLPALLEVASDQEKPDPRDAIDLFDKRIRNVTEDSRAGLVRLSMRWTDGEVAATWANAYAQRLNEQLRRQASEEAERNIAYLKKELAETNIVSLQQSLRSMLEGEMQKLLLTRANDEFVFRTIDKAVAPKSRDSPKRALMVVVALMGGIFLSVIFLVLRRAITPSR